MKENRTRRNIAGLTFWAGAAGAVGAYVKDADPKVFVAGLLVAGVGLVSGITVSHEVTETNSKSPTIFSEFQAKPSTTQSSEILEGEFTEIKKS